MSSKRCLHCDRLLYLGDTEICRVCIQYHACSLHNELTENNQLENNDGKWYSQKYYHSKIENVIAPVDMTHAQYLFAYIKSTIKKILEWVYVL
jgi:hypothetical protein